MEDFTACFENKRIFNENLILPTAWAYIPGIKKI